MDTAREEVLSEELHTHPLAQQFAAYWVEQNAASKAMNLIHFGYGQFHRAQLIAQLDFLRTINEHGCRPEYQQVAVEIGLEGVIDAIRICICFENYMKAALLAKGYFVHELDRGLEGLKSLAKEQSKRPLTLVEVRRESGGWQRSPDGLGFLKGVKKNTLKMSWMLGPGYQEIISLPASIAEFIGGLNEKRNHLHFYLSDGFTTSKQIVQSLEGLISFVNGPMVNMHNSLIENYDLPKRFLIDSSLTHPGQELSLHVNGHKRHC